MLPLTKNRIIYSILGLLLCLVGKDGFGQKEANNWYFGWKQAVNYTTGTPASLNTSMMKAYYGSTSLSDSLGNLLFYSNGQQVFNINNQVMPHGDSIMSDGNSINPCIAFKMPGSRQKYYLFTVASAVSTKKKSCVNYSIIDMSLDGGNGDVVAFQKNIPLHAADSSFQTIGAVKHPSREAYWVIVRNYGNPNKFYSFLVDNSGVNFTPVVSYCILPSGIPNDRSVLMKISPDGKYLLQAWNEFSGKYGSVELYHLDNNSGQLTPALLFNTYADNSGAEFSGNSEYLYLSNNRGIITGGVFSWISQYDLKKINDVTVFENSVYKMVEDTSDIYNGNLLLANNGKIYFCKPSINTTTSNLYLGTINYPFLYGNGCNIQLNGVPLSNSSNSTEGLPTFVSSFMALFDWTGNCVTDSVSFTSHFYPFPNSFTWSFGDPSSGSADTSYLANPKHIYYSPGIYTVSATAVFPNGTSETATRQITISTGPSIQIGDSIYKCPNDSVLLSPGNGFDEYLWSNGSHNATMYAKNPGNYWVQARKLGECMSMDSVRVFNYSGIALNNDSLNIAPTTCSGTTGAITGLQVIGNPPLTYQWTASGTPISDSLDLYHLGVGLYELNVTDGYGCKNTVAAYTISDAGNILIDTAAATPAFCNKPDGTLTITAVSGLGKMLRYFIKTGSDTLSQWGNGRFTALTSGTYYAWVSDSSAVCRSAYSLPI
ncbi:MAG: PKD domain-containing protein, partial [Bacteroidales bacterium]